MIWKDTALGWLLHNMGRPVTLVMYDDIKANTKMALENILKFIQLPYSRERLDIVARAGYSKYRRPPGPKFEHYTESQKALVRDAVRDTVRALKHLQLDLSSFLEP